MRLPVPKFHFENLKSNITYGELQALSFEDVSKWVDELRNELLDKWNDGLPPYIGTDTKTIIERFKKLNDYDLSDMFLEDDLYPDYLGFIKNFSRMGNGVNQFFPAILKSRINGKSIHDYLSNENLFLEFKYTIVQKVRFDKMFQFSKYVVRENETDEKDWESFTKLLKMDDNIGFWFEDYEFNQKNDELHRLKLPSSIVKELLKHPQYGVQSGINRVGFNTNGNEEHFTIRYYKKDTKVFPEMFQTLRVGLNQVAVNFPPLTARWIYEKYLGDLRSL